MVDELAYLSANAVKGDRSRIVAAFVARFAQLLDHRVPPPLSKSLLKDSVNVCVQLCPPLTGFRTACSAPSMAVCCRPQQAGPVTLLPMNATPEQVMVVATGKLRPFFTATLIRHDTEAILDLIEREHTFLDRPVAEVSEEWRQIIPYVVIRHGGDAFVLERPARQTRAALHHKLSLGIPGAINPRPH